MAERKDPPANVLTRIAESWDQLSPSTQIIISVVLWILSSLDSVLLCASIVQDNIHIILGSAISALMLFLLIRFVRSQKRLLSFLPIGLVVAIILLVFLWVLIANTQVDLITVAITIPQDGDSVQMRGWVEGGVSDANADVYILLHPLSINQLWVQNVPVVGSDGSWRALVYFGTEDMGIEDDYEIVAVATKENTIIRFILGHTFYSGQVLNQMPDNINRSNLVMVNRQQ